MGILSLSFYKFSFVLLVKTLIKPIELNSVDLLDPKEKVNNHDCTI